MVVFTDELRVEESVLHSVCLTIRRHFSLLCGIIALFGASTVSADNLAQYRGRFRLGMEFELQESLLKRMVHLFDWDAVEKQGVTYERVSRGLLNRINPSIPLAQQDPATVASGRNHFRRACGPDVFHLRG